MRWGRKRNDPERIFASSLQWDHRLAPLFGDRVFVLRMMLEEVIPLASNVAFDHQLGGPTCALIDIGEWHYRVTIEDVQP